MINLILFIYKDKPYPYIYPIYPVGYIAKEIIKVN